MKGLLTVATAAALVAAPAAAHVVTLTYTGTNDATTATLVLTTSNAHNGLGGFDILSVTGNVSGDAVTTIAPVNPPGFSTDNTYYERDPVFSTGGVGFFSATTTYNLWGTGPGAYTLYGTTNAGASYSPQSTGTLAISGTVPEPAVWGLMIVGFGMIGVATRRRPAATAA